MTGDPENKSANDNSNFNISEKHAWKYFELHATQRISLFKLYIVVLSAYITASGYIIIRIDKVSNIEEFSLMIISIIFIAVTLIFFLLDRRNRKLIHIAEDSLMEMEKFRYSRKEEEVHQVFVREKYFSDNCCTPRHTYCFTALFVLAILCSLLIFFYAWHHSYEINCITSQACLQDCNSFTKYSNKCQS